jgi:hypothetical protein
MGGKKEEIGRYCPNCGAIITYGEYFCRACHTRLTDPRELRASGTIKPGTYIVPARRFWIAFILSGVFPGLGQLYNGDVIKGLAFGIAYMTASFGYIGGQFHGVVLLGIWIAALAESLIAALRINSYVRHFKGTSYILWIGIGGLAAIVFLHLYTGLPDMEYLREIFPVAYFLRL